MMMRSGFGKERGEKAGPPLFPKLHVNDATASIKGGPRPPPRNKMALYEQFSIPSSQRFSSSTTSSSAPEYCITAGNVSVPSSSASTQRVLPGGSRSPSFPAAAHARKFGTDTTELRGNNSKPSSSKRKLQNDDEDDFMVPSILDAGSDCPVAGKDKCSTVACRPEKANKKQRCAMEAAVMAAGKPSDVGNSEQLSWPLFAEKNGHRSSSATVNNAEKRSQEEKCTVDIDGSSDSSTVDPLQGWSMTPDDVVSLIGPKHFWKARRAIINQQRLFAVQVFELHRLIKVQKLMAASPAQVLGDADSLCQKRSCPPAVENPLLQHGTKCPTPVSENNSPEPPPRTERSQGSEDSSQVLARPCDDGNKGRRGDDIPSSASHDITAPVAAPAAPEGNPGGVWLQSPMPNQWLVPLMSPSEGLVYKPYAGSCPPAGSIMSPFFPGCNLMNLAFGIPTGPHHPLPMAGNHHFPSLAMPMTTPMATAGSTHQSEQHSRNSCNMPPRENKSLACHIRMPPSQSEAHGSSAGSSPFDKPKGGNTSCGGSDRGRRNTAPAPESLTHASSDSGEQNNSTRAIKVIPHNNGRSATESAARIFRCIQRERLRCEH